MLVRCPGMLKAGTVTNELMSHNDWLPMLASIAGEPQIVDKLRKRLAIRPVAQSGGCRSHTW